MKYQILHLKMLTTLWSGLIGALLMYVGDMLMYYTPNDFSYDPKSSSEEKINPITDVMKNLPVKRVMAGGMIGPVSAFFLACFGIIAGGAYHSHCTYLGLLGDDKNREALNTVTKYFQKMILFFMPEKLPDFFCWNCCSWKL